MHKQSVCVYRAYSYTYIASFYQIYVNLIYFSMQRETLVNVTVKHSQLLSGNDTITCIKYLAIFAVVYGAIVHYASLKCGVASVGCSLNETSFHIFSKDCLYYLESYHSRNHDQR